jgi:hypothetical protein
VKPAIDDQGARLCRGRIFALAAAVLICLPRLEWHQREAAVMSVVMAGFLLWTKRIIPACL